MRPPQRCGPGEGVLTLFQEIYIITSRNSSALRRPAMKQKVGTVLDARLVRRAKVYAAQRRRPLNSVIEEPLAAWLDRPGAATPAGSLVARSAGASSMTEFSGRR